MSEEPDNDFPVRPVPRIPIGSLVQSSFYMNEFPAHAKSCKYQICEFSYHVHFYSIILPKWNLIQTCSVIQAHLPDFYNPPPLDADSVSRVSETYRITMDAALYRLFTPSPPSRGFDTKDLRHRIREVVRQRYAGRSALSET